MSYSELTTFQLFFDSETRKNLPLYDIYWQIEPPVNQKSLDNSDWDSTAGSKPVQEFSKDRTIMTIRSEAFDEFTQYKVAVSVVFWDVPSEAFNITESV